MKQTSVPEELFGSINERAIQRFIRDKREEDPHLDCKRANAELSGEDRKNFAKALSGFANSDGGVILWGVIAEKSAPSDADVICGTQPIQPLSTFLSRLNEFTPQCVDPPVGGVRHRRIPLKGKRDEGLAITLVPASDLTPHMAKGKENRYFKRNGSSFLQMEHFDVADMFGRRRRAVLEIEARLSIEKKNYERKEPRLRVTYILRNVGRGSAHAPYIELPAKGFRHAGASHVYAHLMRWFPVGEKMLLLAGADLVVHPGTEIEIGFTEKETAKLDTSKDWNMEYSVAAVDLPLERRTLQIPAAELRERIGATT